ncbi:hypothetical protein [Hufsiella ginkgonis]|uniref:Uncharacterized protein n=1 Tax=Hufsiella ginkgonis TaxID=2695274 RepID=A0A7K1XSW6_9SPHI|nr:hypothetical protein [Hufsiella ginkgonis]MXV14095.1 hypothetical protein [Hufsiella ginkgonis]
MKRSLLAGSLILLLAAAFKPANPTLTLKRETAADSMGACQGISYQHGRIFLYGDREVGMIREFKRSGDSLVYLKKEYRLTQNGADLIGHPTGIAVHRDLPVFIGNSVKLNPEGTRWKTDIYCVNWNGLLKSGTLDGNLLNTIDDDACIQGTRPEYVRYRGKWYVATADYGDHGNEVRLYDPGKLRTCRKSSEPGVLFKKFTCSPWVQNLYWADSKNTLVLIQNQVEGRKWKFTFVDMEKSLDSGKMVVKDTQLIDSREDELEGFALIGNLTEGIAVTSARKKNVNFMHLGW